MNKELKICRKRNWFHFHPKYWPVPLSLDSRYVQPQAGSGTRYIPQQNSPVPSPYAPQSPAGYMQYSHPPSYPQHQQIQQGESTLSSLMRTSRGLSPFSVSVVLKHLKAQGKVVLIRFACSESSFILSLSEWYDWKPSLAVKIYEKWMHVPGLIVND